MKSSHNLNPIGKTFQTWIPVELDHHNAGVNTNIAKTDGGTPVPLFDALARIYQWKCSITPGDQNKSECELDQLAAG